MKKVFSGFGIVEIIVAMGIFVIIAVTAVSTISQSFSTVRLGDNETDATIYAQEGIEATRSIKNNSWANLTNGNHGATSGGGSWAFSGTSDSKGSYTRQITVADVYRDIPTNNMELTGCANVLDLNAKKVTSTVNWNFTATRANVVSLEAYFTYWKKIAFGNWASPSQESSGDLAGTQDGIKVWTQLHYAYVLRNGGSPNFAIFDVRTSTPSLVGSLTLGGNPTNLHVFDRYAYISNSIDATELQIVDVCDPTTPTLVGTLNAVGNGDGEGVFVSGNYAYLVRRNSPEPEFIVVDVSTPSSPSVVGSLRLNTLDNEVFVKGNYAYVASSSDAMDLQVIDVSTPSSPTLTSGFNLPTNNDGLAIDGFDSVVVVGRQNGEVDIVDVSTPSAPSVLGSYAAGATVSDVSLGNANLYAFLGTNNNAMDFQVIDISSLSTPVLLGFVNFANNVRGIAYNSFNDRAYGATLVDAQELASFKPL